MIFKIKARKEKGFTLIEVMITIVIMAALSVLTYQTIRNTAANRGRIQELLKNETMLSDALRVMEHDISRAFHYRNIHFEVLKASREEMAKAQQNIGQEGGPPQAPGGSPPPPPPPQQGLAAAAPQEPLVEPPNYTGFVGDASTLHLTTLSNYRTFAGSPESDQLTVGYTLENCPRRTGAEDVQGQCLMRSYRPYLERDIERGGIKDVVVENVESLNFRYFGEGQEDWTDRWDSTEGGEEFSRNLFPLAVEVSLSLYTSAQPTADGRRATLQRTIIVPLRFPNNPEGTRPQRSGVRDVPL